MTWFLAIAAGIMVVLAAAMIYEAFFWTGETRRKKQREGGAA